MGIRSTGCNGVSMSKIRKTTLQEEANAVSTCKSGGMVSNML
jgi:hypothetical protein